MKNVNWRVLIYRLFGVLNLLFAAIGAFFEASSITAVRAGVLANTSDAPYFLAFFWIMFALNFCFFGLLALGGVYLLRLKNWGVTISNIVMTAEIVYFPLIGVAWSSFSKTMSMSVAGATGIANVGIGFQLITAYPLFALGCLNWVRWWHKRRTLIRSATVPSS